MSNIKKHQRSQSDAEFLHNAQKLEQEVTDLLLRDLGVKRDILEHCYNASLDEASADFLRELRCKYHMGEDDAADLEAVIHRAKVDCIELNKYPDWLINRYRARILDAIDGMVNNIRYANSIYITAVTPEQDYAERRRYWSRAIANCYQIATWLDSLRRKVDVDANKYDPYLDRIEKEIALLKGVRSSDNKALRRAQAERDKNMAHKNSGKPPG